MPLETRIGPDTHVTLAYTLFGEDGEVIEQTEEQEPVTYVHGYGQIVPGLERAIEGLVSGQTRSVTVKPEDAYGEYDEEGVFEVDAADFPDPKNIVVDEEFVAESPDGETLALRVVEVRDDAVVVDANHPLAGETLRFDVRVLAVRAATAAEIAEAEREADEVESASACGCGEDHDAHDHDAHAHGDEGQVRLVGLGAKPKSHGPS